MEICERSTGKSPRALTLASLFMFIFLNSSFFFLAISGCQDSERTALLQLKYSLERARNSIHPNLLLSSWSRDNADCCAWARVNCSEISGRATRLNLANLGEDAKSKIPWYLNLSVFSSFPELEHLDLSNNQIAGSMTAAISDLTAAKKLRILDLSFNKLEGEVPCSLRLLRRLTRLDLTRNNLRGRLPDCLGELRNLENITLRYNNLRGGIPAFLGNASNLLALDLTGNGLQLGGAQVLARLSKLRTLNLDGNQFDEGLPSFFRNMSSLYELHLRGTSLAGEIPELLGNISGLRLLDLGWNDLEGTIPAFLGRLKKLEKLYLDNNRLRGRIPLSLNTATSLRRLDMSGNRLEGELDPRIFEAFASLEELRLDDNKLSGFFSFEFLAPCSRLEVVSLSGNRMLRTDMNSVERASILQLSELYLSNCDLSENRGLDQSLFLKSQHRLTFLEMSDSGLSGSLPSWLFENNVNLEIVLLKNNSLRGEFPLLKTPASRLFVLDVGLNRIGGSLPGNLSSMLPSLSFLGLSWNNFTGSIPPLQFIERAVNYVMIDLGFNQFTGEVPLLPEHADFAFFNVQNNHLSGEIRGNLARISYWGGNNFTGFSQNLSNIQGVEIFDAQDNHLSGEFPEFLWNLKQLSTLVLRGNKFNGEIPRDLCKMQTLTALDMSENMFSGTIPRCLKRLKLRYLNLGSNILSGQAHDMFADLSLLDTLDLRGNSFSGDLDWTIGLRRVRLLLLGENKFGGQIPTYLCRLSELQLLDLSRNSLSGVIPECLDNTRLSRGPEFGPNSYQAISQAYYQYPMTLNALQEAKFSTKGGFQTYTGPSLYLMVGMDFSSNNLHGEIPPQIGDLESLRSLNLSRNRLIGEIPWTLSSIRDMESLDLSHNSLDGPIPPQLTRLSSLAGFSVAYNRLVGCIPVTRQFATFDSSSYVGNKDLHGPPLDDDSCNPNSRDHPASRRGDDGREKTILKGIICASFATFFLITSSIFFLSRSCDIGRMWMTRFLQKMIEYPRKLF